MAACSTNSRRCARISVCVTLGRGGWTRSISCVKITCLQSAESLQIYLAYLLSCHFQLLGIRLVFCGRCVCTRALTECILPDTAVDGRVQRPGRWNCYHGSIKGRPRWRASAHREAASNGLWSCSYSGGGKKLACFMLTSSLPTT